MCITRNENDSHNNMIKNLEKDIKKLNKIFDEELKKTKEKNNGNTNSNI